MRILVTRPRDDATGLVAELDARRHEVVLEPLLTIVPRAAVDWPEGHERAQALLVTSANGARAFAALDPRRALPVCAVGEASAAAARGLGFAKVASAGGDVDDLAALVRRRLDPAEGPLLHPAAAKPAGDLQGALAAEGFVVLRAVLYDAHPVKALSPQATQAIGAGAIDAVTLFSPRTAAAFASLVAAAGLAPACCRIAALCLSQAVAAEIAGLTWREIVVAGRPEQTSLLDALDRLAAR